MSLEDGPRISPTDEPGMIFLLAGRAAADHNPTRVARMRTARHEAAHVVAAYLSGKRIKSVSIEPEPGVCAGRVELDVGVPETEFSKVLRNQSDLRKALLFIRAWREPKFDWRAARREVRRLQGLARVFVEQNWSLIRDVADELLNRPRLPAAEVEALLDRAVEFRRQREELALRLRV
jgi:hypothetical protein